MLSDHNDASDMDKSLATVVASPPTSDEGEMETAKSDSQQRLLPGQDGLRSISLVVDTSKSNSEREPEQNMRFMSGHSSQGHDQFTPLMTSIKTENDFLRSFKERKDNRSRFFSTRWLPGRRSHKSSATAAIGGDEGNHGSERDHDNFDNKEHRDWGEQNSGKSKCHMFTEFYNVKRGFLRSFPVIAWLPKYELRKQLLRDTLIGVTLGFVIAPKAMAHGLLAELSPIHGIYTAFFSTLVYGAMGNGKWLSLATAALPPMLTCYIALWTFVMLFLRLDKLVVLIPPAVLAAFTTTAAFLIGTSQVKYLFGVHIEASGFVQTYVQLFSHIGETNLATFLFSVMNLIILVGSKKATARWGKRFGIPDAGAMFAVLISVGLVDAGFNLDERYGIEVAGSTPRGMPPFRLPWKYITDSSLHMTFLIDGMIIAIINFVLIALGSFFGAQVSGGSFSGSAILASLKAETLLQNFIQSFIMLLILVALTPLIEILPKATLAAIIVAALPSLVDFHRPIELLRVKFDDFVLWVLTFCITLFAGVQWGIISGAALAVIVLIRRNMRHECPELGVIPGTNIYRALDRFPDAKRIPGIRMFRLDASLSFANFERFEEQLETTIKKMSAQQRREFHDVETEAEANHELPAVSQNTLILSCEAVNDIDSAGLDMLCRISTLCDKHQILLIFSGWKAGTRQTLYAASENFRKPEEPVLAAAGTVDLKRDSLTNELAADKGNPSSIPSSTNSAEDMIDLENPHQVIRDVNPASPGEDVIEGASNIVNFLPAPLDPTKWYLNLHDAVVRSREQDSPNRSSISSSSSSSSSSSAGASPGNDSSSHRSHRRDDSGEGHGGTGASLYSQALQDNTGRTGEGSNDIIDANRRVSAGADLGWEVGHPSSLFYWSPRGVDRRPSDLIIVKKRTNSTPVTRTTELTASGKTHVHTYAQGR
eukprot:CAMPEP_0171507164 /NCGR_PEP_ID=MMETSP0958-20121227/13347_1 /TAXON_ID=87120 /ORGANISM="Aurantiochytrium limacinum, Strain ATCCMYA-1381" /LENGTH=936 /DNA_ID=CAMNT_0012043831 /DNA_START=212 /DNA_END=3024 /DNA_ORIENTATION=-